MATPGFGGEGGGERSIASVARRLRIDEEEATMYALLRRRVRAIALQSAVPIVTSEVAEKIVLQKDFLNVVGSPSPGAVEIEIVRDADGGMRFYVVP